jgi:hypothetical protein
MLCTDDDGDYDDDDDCQNEFRDTFPDSPVPNKSTVYHLVNCLHDTKSVHDRNHSG